jgi:hypothetical protein
LSKLIIIDVLVFQNYTFTDHILFLLTSSLCSSLLDPGEANDNQEDDKNAHQHIETDQDGVCGNSRVDITNNAKSIT